MAIQPRVRENLKVYYEILKSIVESEL